MTHYGKKPGEVELRETQAHARYGVLTSSDTPGPRDVGAEWRVPVNVWRRAPTPAGYRPVLLLDVEAEGIKEQPPASVLLQTVPLAAG